jgi:glycosyltransferase involved in cell wall biosynthesis
MSGPVRVAICPDFREEGWPSMDRVADELLRALAERHGEAVAAVSVLPPFRRRASQCASGRIAANADRGLNRLIDYPAHVRQIAPSFDVFHVVDHSYSQLVHALPGGRTIVTCHDLDTFRSLLDPEADSRSRLFNAMTQRILTGLSKAACVTCDTAAVRDELLEAGLVGPDRIVVVPVGVNATFKAEADVEADASAARLLPPAGEAVDVLHVGSVIDRKRIDVLLACCAELRRSVPALRLVRVGGPFTHEQEQMVRALGLGDCIASVPHVDDATLAALYRRAALVLMPSEREGFGLPVAEALACGTPVVASNLPVLREVGGAAVEYCAVGDVPAWTRTVLALLDERRDFPDRWAARRAQGAFWAGRFTWTRFADRMVTLYLELAGASQPASVRPRTAWPA